MWLVCAQRQTGHTVLLSRGRGTLVQDVVLTFRQMPGGWPSYEKGTATTCYLTGGGFEKSLVNDRGRLALGWRVKQLIRIRRSEERRVGKEDRSGRTDWPSKEA